MVFDNEINLFNTLLFIMENTVESHSVKLSTNVCVDCQKSLIASFNHCLSKSVLVIEILYH